MKRYSTFIISIIAVLFVSCSDVQYESIGDKPMPVKDLQIENKDGEIHVSWSLPEDASASVLQYNNERELEIDKVQTTRIFSNPEVNVEHVVTVKAKYPDNRTSEGITRRITINGTNPVSDLKAERVDDTIVLTWKLSSSNSATSIDITWNDNVPVSIDATETSYVINNVSPDQSYRIGVRTKNNNMKSHYIYAEVKSQKIAYLMSVESSEDIVDDDEIASYQWFTTTYPNGEVLTPVTLLSIDLSSFAVIWIHVDQTGLQPGPDNLPAALIDGDVVNALSTYYKEGGNLLLTNHATQYIISLGRLATDRSPGIFGSGEGGSGSDVWSFNPNIGMIYDNSSHPIFESMDRVNDFGFPTIPLIGPGHREDHNSMWDLNAYSYTAPGDNVVEKFQNEKSVKILATWGHVTDFCCAGIIEFYPTAEYKGRCIAIGLAAYEWNQNSNPNIYQDQIELLTSNILKYLQQ